MRIRRDETTDAEGINVTSLVDVMFILIIFFLATTTFQQEERDVKVSLPDAAASESLSAAPKIVVVNVREDGSYFLGSRSIGLDELQPALVQALNENPDQKVLIRGDRRARHGQVASAVLACKQAGIHEANIGYEIPQ